MTDHPSSKDDQLDETIEETFPASDAPANTVETGLGLATAAFGRDRPPVDRVTDNGTAHRLELVVGGQLAFLVYERKPHAFVLVHTEVPASLRGRGIGSTLVQAGLRTARREGLRIVAMCPFARAFLRTHPASGETR